MAALLTDNAKGTVEARELHVAENVVLSTQLVVQIAREHLASVGNVGAGAQTCARHAGVAVAGRSPLAGRVVEELQLQHRVVLLQDPRVGLY